MNENWRSDRTREVFQKEFEKLEHYRHIAGNINITADELFEHFKNLIRDYDALLMDSVKITRIGDVSQNKLLKAKEKIEDLNAKLVESERNVRELNTILMFYIKATDK